MVILVCEAERCTCSCGVGVSFGATAHTKAVGYGKQRPPCGKRFTHTAVDEADPAQARKVIETYPSLPFLGCGEVTHEGGKTDFLTHRTPNQIFGIS